MKRVQNIFAKTAFIAVVGIGLSACTAEPVPVSVNTAYAYPEYGWGDPALGWDPAANSYWEFDFNDHDTNHDFDHDHGFDHDHDVAHDSGGGFHGGGHDDGGHDSGGHDGGGHGGGGHR